MTDSEKIEGKCSRCEETKEIVAIYYDEITCEDCYVSRKYERRIKYMQKKHRKQIEAHLKETQ